MRDLSVLLGVIPFAVAFRILIAFAYNRTAYAVLVAAITHASFNARPNSLPPTRQAPWPKSWHSPPLQYWRFSPSF